MAATTEHGGDGDGEEAGAPRALRPVERRYSGLDEATGRKAANVVEENPPPVERPWWMKLHGDGPAVSTLAEVMEQFLMDADIRAVERSAETAIASVDPPRFRAVVPGVATEDIEDLVRWHGHVSKFLKYRDLVRGQHGRKLPTPSRGAPQRSETASSRGSESEDDDDDSEASSTAHGPREKAPVMRTDKQGMRRATRRGSMLSNTSGADSPRRKSTFNSLGSVESPPLNRRPSNFGGSAAAAASTRRPSVSGAAAAGQLSGRRPSMTIDAAAAQAAGRRSIFGASPRLSKVGAVVAGGSPSGGSPEGPSPGRSKLARRQSRIPSAKFG